MSRSLCTVFLESIDAIAINFGLKPFMGCRLRDEIDVDTEQMPDSLVQRKEIPTQLQVGAQFYCQIEVGLRGCFVARR